MTKEKNKESKLVGRISLEDVSPKFQEKQAVIDACASDDEIMKEYIVNGNLNKAFNGYFSELRKAKEKLPEFPIEMESNYIDSYLEVSRKLNKFYGF